MIDLIKIYKADGITSITVNDDVSYPVEMFNWTPTMIGDDLPHLQGPGRFPNYKEVEAMPIEMEGHIKANTPELYWTARKALLNIVIPDFNQTFGWHGYVEFQAADTTTLYRQKVHVVHWEVPIEALYPTVTPFRFEWEGLDGYWTDKGTGLPAKL